MQLLAAPLVYSRTLVKGFSPNFLVYPEGFENDREWARSYVVPALVKADDLDNACRVCSFQNENYIVVGVCSFAKFLCDDTNYLFVDEVRPNYGFFGYVFKKSEFKSFLIPKCENENVPEIFKRLYQHVIDHWKNDDHEKDSYPCSYQPLDVDEVDAEVDKLPLIPKKDEMVCVPPEQFNLSLRIIEKGYSFCLNMPSISDAKSSLFDYVFIPKTSKIEVKKRVDKSDTEAHFDSEIPKSPELPSSTQPEIPKQPEWSLGKQDDVEQNETPIEMIENGGKQIFGGAIKAGKGFVKLCNTDVADILPNVKEKVKSFLNTTAPQEQEPRLTKNETPPSFHFDPGKEDKKR